MLRAIHMGETVESTKASARISGLDSIRFICAVIVLLMHAPLSFPASLGVLNSFYAVLFNGPAAVIVFFVISGFCIHISQAKNKSYHVDILPFVTRRLIRLGIPAVAAAILYFYCGADLAYPAFGVLWSIICEGIYYLLYPLLLVCAQKFGWMRMIIASAVIALLAVLTNIPLIIEDQNGYIALGLFTWVIGLAAAGSRRTGSASPYRASPSSMPSGWPFLAHRSSFAL
jgi:peptidoglycan/LPS O-acetylase OafA/YrhL